MFFLEIEGRVDENVNGIFLGDGFIKVKDEMYFVVGGGMFVIGGIVK